MKTSSGAAPSPRAPGFFARVMLTIDAGLLWLPWVAERPFM
jgi:hypothetical protein